MTRRVFFLVLAVAMGALGACTPVSEALSEAERERILLDEIARLGGAAPPGQSDDEAAAAPAKASALAAESEPVPPKALETRITLSASGAPLSAVLVRLAGRAGLRLAADPDVNLEAPVTVSVPDLAVRHALRMALAPLHYSFRVQGEELVVYEFETRGWTLSLPSLTFSASTDVTNQSGRPDTETAARRADPSALMTGVATNINLGAMATVRTETRQISTWDELERALKGMTSAEGMVAINRTLGLVTVRDRPDRLEAIDRFVSRHEAHAARQIDVSVRALEVALATSDQAGIDWSRVWKDVVGTTDLTLTGSFATPLTLPASIGPTGSARGDLLVKALSTQGRVRVLSQPSIRLMNGLPAVIQVGRVQAFVAQADQSISGPSGLTTGSIRLGSVQDGVILSITARIVGDEIILTLAPVISRIRQIRQVASGTLTVEAPDIDTRALQTTLRLTDGQTVVLGGILGPLLGSFEPGAERSELVLTITTTIVQGS
ncbi:MAG: hypothetical protein ACE5NC_02735 [Anaerolineae bacterium]